MVEIASAGKICYGFSSFKYKIGIMFGTKCQHHVEPFAHGAKIDGLLGHYLDKNGHVDKA